MGSWGFLDSKHEYGYWFVKQKQANHDPLNDEDISQLSWPEPLATFVRVCGMNYAHPIFDADQLQRWSSPNVTLIGDACHAVTPNNGQGACMAIEDALILATLLREH